MADIFFISDTHFGHAATIFKFQLEDGTPMRKFASAEEMDEHMVQNWNRVVRPQDKVYHLGDVAMHDKHIPTVGRCNGHKRLLLGNHEKEKIKFYTPYFEAFYSTRKIDKLFMSHIPIHPESLHLDYTNVHGHVHNNVGPLHYGPRYFNVSVEVIDYTPVALEDLKIRIRKQMELNQELIQANLDRMGIKRLWTDEELRRG